MSLASEVFRGVGQRRVASSWLALLLVASAPAACSSEPLALSWRFSFSEDVVRDRVHVVRARILGGGCASLDDVRYEAFAREDGRLPDPPPELGPGRFGFDGLATDTTCTVVAAGCVERTLPSEGALDVELSPVSPPRELCAASACSAGVCAGGLRDAGPDLGPPSDLGPPPDLGPPDTGPIDLGRDLGRDAGSPRIPIARVHQGFSIGGMTYLRVAFTARPEEPGEPSGLPLDPEYFWAVPPGSDSDRPCPTGLAPLGAYYAPDRVDARQVYYTATGGPPAGYTAVPPFACVPLDPDVDTIDIRQLSRPGAPAAEFYYTHQSSEVMELTGLGYDDDGVAFRGYRGP
ncbi:MAG: hypothetical protein IT379_16990 [Deltaproteobacteria bacterium]|nr:hypothetical protein [Deltaproteobacteria bacterium]